MPKINLEICFKKNLSVRLSTFVHAINYGGPLSQLFFYKLETICIQYSKSKYNTTNKHKNYCSASNLFREISDSKNCT